jgi:Mg-chelatase subunit ChlD
MSNAFSQLSPEERDARITSLLLGELPPAEAEELRQVIASDPELTRACERRECTIAMLRAACRQHPAGEPSAAPDVQEPIPARLSDDRREKLLEMFRSGAVADDEPRRWRIPSWFMPMSAAAVLVVALSVAALLTSRRSREMTRVHLMRGDTEASTAVEFVAAQPVDQQVWLMSKVDHGGQVSGQVDAPKRYYAARANTPNEFRSFADPVADQPSSTFNVELRRAEPTPTPQPQVRMEIAGKEYFFESAAERQLPALTPPPILGEAATPAPAVTPLPPIVVSGSAVAAYSTATTPEATPSKPRDNNGASVDSSDGFVTIITGSNFGGTHAMLALNSDSDFVAANGLAAVPGQFPAFGSGSFVTSGGSGLIQNPAAAPASGPEPGFLLGADNVPPLGRFKSHFAPGELVAKTGKDNRSDSFGIEPMADRTPSPVGTNINAPSASAGQSGVPGLGFDWYAKNGGIGGGGGRALNYFDNSDFAGEGFVQGVGARTIDDDRAVRYVNGAEISQVSSNTQRGNVALDDSIHLFGGAQIAQSEQKYRFGGGDFDGVQNGQWGGFGNGRGDAGAWNMPINRPTPSERTSRVTNGFDVGGVQDREGHAKWLAGGGLAGSRTGFGNRLNQTVVRAAPAANTPLGDLDMDGSYVVTTDPAGLPFTSRDERRALQFDSLRSKQVVTAGAQTQEGIVAEQEKQLAQGLKDVEKKSGARTNTARPSPEPTAASPTPATPPPVPQPEVLTRDNPFSTFSLNVSDVSFKLAAASLEKGAMPDVASIRSEEFINAFDYRDPQPARGAPIAFAWDRARYPFAHNREVVRFSIKTAAQGRESGRPLNIVLLLDNSGSMERADRVRIIQESLRTLASQLKPLDKISVVTFARTASLRVDGLSGTNAVEAMKQIGAITPDGGTNLEDALDLAYRTALRHYEATAVNRVVLLTDGAANLGNVEPKSLKAKVEGFRKQGIALDCFGIGWEGYNDDLLEQLSRNGDGRYGFVNTPEEAASEFVGQLAGALRVAASDVKMQVEFNPRRVTAYRQIGYAKHQLTKEQFRDNKVDAAEIGAAESGNALYVIETNPNGEGPIATVRARFRIPQTSDYREHEWVVPFGSAVELEQANPALRLSTTASAFSEWLASSPFAGDVTTDRLLRILSGVPDNYGADPRPKKLEWMIRQAKSISGK